MTSPPPSLSSGGWRTDGGAGVGAVALAVGVLDGPHGDQEGLRRELGPTPPATHPLGGRGRPDGGDPGGGTRGATGASAPVERRSASGCRQFTRAGTNVGSAEVCERACADLGRPESRSVLVHGGPQSPTAPPPLRDPGAWAQETSPWNGSCTVVLIRTACSTSDSSFPTLMSARRGRGRGPRVPPPRLPHQC